MPSASFDKRPNGSWRLRWRNKGAKKQTPHTYPPGLTKAERDAIVAEVKKSISMTGTWSPARQSPTTVAEVFEAFIAARQSRSARWSAASASTLRGYRAALTNSLEPFLRQGRQDSPSVTVLTRRNVDAWLGAILDGKTGRAPVSQTTAVAYSKALRSCWGWAHEEWPGDVPAPAMPRMKKPKSRPQRPPSFEDIDKGIAALTDRAAGLRRALIIQRFLGLRVGQARKLRWSDLDSDWESLGPAVNIGAALAKTEAEANWDRWIPIHPQLWALLQQWRAEDRSGAQGLLVGAKMGKRPDETMRAAWSRSGVNERFWRGHPTHCLRARLVTAMRQTVPDAPRRYFFGREGGSVEDMSYSDEKLWFKTLAGLLPEVVTPLSEELAAKVEKSEFTLRVV